MESKFVTTGLGRVMEQACGLAIDLDDAKELVSRFIGSLFDKDSRKIEFSRPTTRRAFLEYFSKKCGRSVEDVAKKLPLNALEELRQKHPHWNLDFDLSCDQQVAEKFFCYRIHGSTFRFTFSDGAEEILELSTLSAERLRELVSIGVYETHQTQSASAVPNRDHHSGDHVSHMAEKELRECLPACPPHRIRDAVNQLSIEEQTALLVSPNDMRRKIAASIGNIQGVPSIRQIVEAVSEAIEA